MLIPSLMVFATLVLGPRVNRIVNIALGSMYALTITAGVIGEWSYYILGSIVEVALLATFAYHAWTWPKLAQSTSAMGREVTPSSIQPAVL